MIEEMQFLSQPIISSSTISHPACPRKVSVYFTYQSSPQEQIRQNLKVINQQQEEKKRKRIFQPRRKLSYQSISTSKRRLSRLKIFQQPSRKASQTIKSHIFLKDSTISGVDTIVDQLDEFNQSVSLMNPINKKLSSIKNRQSKGNFYSNTVQNSIVFKKKLSQQSNRNRIQSEVLNYQYSPNLKNRSSVTIKASHENRLYGVSKLSNGISILTNENQLLSQFQDKEDLQTPKYHKSTYKSMRKSMGPGLTCNVQKKCEQKNQPIIQVKNSHTDRFYDEASLQTPRLSVVNKRVSYEVIDPLTSELKKQKFERKQLRRLSEVMQVKNKQSNPIKTFFLFIITLITQIVSSTITNVRKCQEKCSGFVRSELFFLVIIVVLSLTIFGIQLVQ